MSVLDESQQAQDSNNAALSSDSTVLKSDLTSILNSKLQQDTSMDATRGLHFMSNDDFNAKRNLTLMLETKQINQVSSDNNGGVNLFDNLNTGTFNNSTGQQEMSLFNNYTPKGDVTLASASLYEDSNKYIQGGGSGQCTPGGPTPPGSQNQTPDLTP